MSPPHHPSLPQEFDMPAINSAISSTLSQFSSVGASLLTKSGKLASDNTSISQMKNEAAGRYSSAMSAATSEMALGIVAGGTQVGSAITVLRGNTASSLLGDVRFHDPRKSDLQQIKPNALEAAQKQADTGTDATSSARDRKKAGLDNIQKFLDILRWMNPQI